MTYFCLFASFIYCKLGIRARFLWNYDCITPIDILDIAAFELFAIHKGFFFFRWKSKFICSLCHKNGQVSEATKDLKYCSARAQHSWSNNKKVMLVYTAKRSWAVVRDLPYLKNKVSSKFHLEKSKLDDENFGDFISCFQSCDRCFAFR